MSKIYDHTSPGKLIVGPGAVNRFAELIDPKETYLIVTDPGLSAAGMAQRTAKALQDAGIKAEIFDRVKSDPPFEVVEEAARVFKDKSCSALIGLGGGSSMDAAKAVAVRVSKTDRDIMDYTKGEWVEGPLVPLYAIPTTAGTGSEATRVAVITDSAANVKTAIRGEELLPRAAVLDPLLLSELPPRVAAETGADALCHAVEAYVSLNSNIYTDALAIEAIGLVGQYLRRMSANPADIEAAEGMLVASCLAGQAFTNAGLGLIHSMGEPLGAFYHISHGLTCALYMPVIMEFNLLAAESKFADITAALGEDTEGMSLTQAAKLAPELVRELLDDIGIPLTYEQLGIDFKLDPQMVDDVKPQFSTTCNPRKADDDQIRQLFMAPLQEY